MKLYEIYYPALEMSAKFKSLTPQEAQAFHEKYSHLPKLQYILLTLDQCIYNLRKEVKAVMNILSKEMGDEVMMSLYNGCIMLNPILDLGTWMELTYGYNVFKDQASKEIEKRKMDLAPISPPLSDLDFISTLEDRNPPPPKPKPKPKNFSIPPSKYAALERHLNEKVIGQVDAVKKITFALKRAQASLNDPNRPIGVFMFAGPSGVGKTLIAKALQEYLYGANDLIRVDCGEYQHKHENQKLIGSPAGFVGYDDGGQLTKAIGKNPNTVLLLDEAEKAHPDFWNTFLKVFDDGYITDNKGNNISFKNVIVIITSNLGNDKVSEATYGRGTGFNANIENTFKSKIAPKRELMERETQEAMRKFFKPELLNRLDDIVVFNHLSEKDYLSIAELEMLEISDKLNKQQFELAWNEDVLILLTQLSGAALEGARGMSRVRRDKIENLLADALLNHKYPKGTIFNITVQNNEFVIT